MSTQKDFNAIPEGGTSPFFLKAKPIWKKGESEWMNSIVLFRLEFPKKENVRLRLTACNEYRATLNGALVGYGPARASHGYSRVDEYALDASRDKNVLLIEAAAYNTKTFDTLFEPGFLIAELSEGDEIFAYTGRDFLVRRYEERLRKVDRYSFQRAFIEAYDFRKKNPANLVADLEGFETPEIVEGRIYQKRGVSYPNYEHYRAEHIESGTFRLNDDEIEENPWIRSPLLPLFPLEEREINPHSFGLRLEYALGQKKTVLGEGEFSTFALENSRTGFIGLSLDVLEEAEVYLYFDEIDLAFGQGEMVDLEFCRIGSNNCIVYRLAPGNFSYTGFEPYSAKYLRLVVRKGKVANANVYMRGYENPDTSRFVFRCANPELENIVEAARNNFRANAVDLLTDCPSRERAGWLCDSYFTSMAEKLMTGENKVERNFLDNYLHFQANLPKGMVPMCYPADSYDGNFIPNWALFYIIEVANLARREGNKENALAHKANIEGIFAYFKDFENEFGLLENLEAWVFVEWSKANDDEFLSGVNFPSNMMYGYALKEAGWLLGDSRLIEKGEEVLQNVNDLAWDGEFYVDNAVRENGILKQTRNISEACQYYAFFTGTASLSNRVELFETLLASFGAKRDDTTVYPYVHKSNAFIGNFLRLMMLAENGAKNRLDEECVAYFSKMASLTGSLWEKDYPRGCSLNHGFASFVANLLVDYLCGYQGNEGKWLHFSSPAVDIDCHLEIPLGEDVLVYDRQDGKVTLSIPEGYAAEGIQDDED